MMKRIASIVMIVFNITGFLYSQELTGEQIINRVSDLINQETIYSRSKMTIITSSGEPRTFEYESWSKDRGEKNLIRYLAPSRVRDQATLMLNYADDIWMFFPRTQRVRKLATHAKKQKIEGSDFSYEDMGSGDAFIQDFKTNRLEDEKMEDQNCYKLELIRNEESDVSYSRLIMWVIKKNFIPIVMNYYDESDSNFLLKRLVQSNIKVIDQIPTPMKMVMTNKQDNTQTSMELIEVQYNIPMEDDLFTERGLKK